MELDLIVMAMGDEDTVMGDASSHHHHHHQANDAAAASGESMPPHLNGGSDPSLAPAIIGQPVSIPLPARPDHTPADHGLGPPHGDYAAPVKTMGKPVELGDPIGEPVDNLDSSVEENSDWPDDEADVARMSGGDDGKGGGVPAAGLASGLCYDVQMRYHCEVRPTADVHPEDPRRIYYIYKELCRAGLVDDPESTKPIASRPLKRINARNATEAEISLVHTPDHFAFVQSTKGIVYLFGGLDLWGSCLTVYRYVG